MNNNKKLSAIMPCYNEKDSILDLVKKVKKSPIKKPGNHSSG